MLVKLVWQILLLCTFCIFGAENAALNGCPKSKVGCFCGEEPNYEISFFEILPEFFNDNKAKDCHDRSSEVCASHSCLSAPTVASKDEEHYVIAKKINPLNIIFLPLDKEAVESHSKLIYHRRIQRKSINNTISSIYNAVMECSVGSGFVNCEINCIHGYAMEEDGKVVQKTTRKYQESERSWYPSASFPFCKPFINCKAVLSKPGNLDCKISGPTISYCNISCEADYEHDELAKRRYECLDENFAKTLPHCATIAKDVDLIQAPQDPQKAVPKP